MANTYSQVYLQIVFSVKRRQNLLEKEWREELYKYICGIANAKGQKIYAVGGISDHIHILVSMKPNISISEFVRDIKANSSRWINDRGLVQGRFQWQEGYGVFSYGQSQLDRVIRYINNQERHHEKKSFVKEYRQFLELYQIEYDKKYLVDKNE